MGVHRLYKAASPYNADELPQIDVVQSFDVMYIAHLNHAPGKLVRGGHTDWQFLDVTFGPTTAVPGSVSAVATTPNTDAANSGDAYFPQPASYVVTAIDGETGQESHASTPDTCTNDLTLKRNYNTITWSAVTGAVRYRIYKANNTSDFGYIGSTESLSFVDDFIEPDLTIGIPQGANPFEAGDGDNPSTNAFYEQRLWWGRTTNNPNALYSSRSADFENMDVSVPLRADDAVSIRLVAQGVCEINQLVSLQSLLALSSDGIFKIEGANEDYISANPPPRQRRQAGRGSSRLAPIVIDNVIFYKTINSSDVRAAGYSFQEDGIATNNVCTFSPDFFEGFDIVSWCYAEEPLSCIWAARSDGMLLCFTWEKEQQVWGWTQCPLPNDGKVKSLCSVQEQPPGATLSESRVYAIIEFNLQGEPREVRCRMASARWLGLAYECHLDCSVTAVFEEPASVVFGLWHLEGETVAALVDGVVVEGLVVANGSVTLPEGIEGTVVTVGLPYDAVVETLPLYLPFRGSTNTGSRHAIGEAFVSLVRSRAPEVGIRKDGETEVAAARMRAIKSRYTGPLNDEASLLNGVYQVETDPVVSLEGKVTLRHRIGPLTVNGIYLAPQVTG